MVVPVDCARVVFTDYQVNDALMVELVGAGARRGGRVARGEKVAAR